MKGIILAGGSGSRLRPLTLVTNKHLLPVYDKPMIAWPLLNLVQAGIKDIFVVTGGDHFSAIGGLLGSGDLDDMNRIGIETAVNISYGVQKKPAGIAHALGLAREFAGCDPVTVVLGDNIFEDGDFLSETVDKFREGARIFLKKVPDASLYEDTEKGTRAKYGVAEIVDGHVGSIEEKPEKPKSNLAVTGAYIYDASVFDIVGKLKPSARGELEITDVNNAFIRLGQMKATMIQGEWTDAGSIESLKHAGDRAWYWRRR